MRPVKEYLDVMLPPSIRGERAEPVASTDWLHLNQDVRRPLQDLLDRQRLQRSGASPILGRIAGWPEP